MRLFFALAMILASLPVLAGEKVPGMEVKNPWVRATIGKAAVSAGYAIIQDTSGQGDTLMGIEIVKGGKALMHETYVTEDIVRMRTRDKVDLPPGGKIEMSPGGIHIMLLNLTGALKAGDTLPMKLHFARQGDITVDFQIRP